MRGYKNFESDPHPGDLRHLVEIGYTENRINENGYPEETDIVLCKVWSAVTDAGNQHYRSADVMNTEAVVNFTIHYRADVSRACGCASVIRSGTFPLWANTDSGVIILALRRPSPRV